MTPGRLAAALGLLLAAASPARADAWDWLVQKVCVDAGDRPMPADPYAGCPGGTKPRALRPGDPLPYHKYDSGYAGRFQRHDSYPLRLPDGRIVVLNPFDYGESPADPAMEGFKPGGDGFDLYEVAGGWAFASETRDGGGFSQAFFGDRCLRGGWLFFPADVSAGAHGGETAPISDRYWEQNGEDFPGSCAAGAGKSRTDWSFQKGRKFGNKGAELKTMDALVVMHGYVPGKAFPRSGHLEVFYFTRLYGATRWEVWTPDAQDPKMTSSSCVGQKAFTRYGVDFVVTDCRDWSNVVLEDPPRPPAPWPVPELNLLSNFHFAKERLDPWRTQGENAEGGLMISALKNSKSGRDAHFSQTGAGVRYLSLGCGGTCTGRQSMYQDVPVSGKTPSGTYAFGVTARGHQAAGVLELSVSQLDDSERVLDRVSFKPEVQASYPAWTKQDSVLLHSAFLWGATDLRLKPGAVFLRFAISPRTGAAFDISDAWLMHTPGALTAAPARTKP